ncbi:MAG: hypothetical protein ACRBG0_26615 [Lewinella sp.]|uniref:hypothetical protein n=1 Tax=Lewinella sp. TaxID=2004506 RepID=UPI003D6A43A6
MVEFIKDAHEGCPKSQYILADCYINGIGVPKHRERAKYYYKLLADNHVDDLEFMECCYGILLLLIAMLEYHDLVTDEAKKYFHKALDYFRKEYTEAELNQITSKYPIEKYLAELD